MILQNVVVGKEETRSLYVRTKGAVAFSSNAIVLDEGAEVSSDTYFGSFSLGKWKQYSTVSDFSLHLFVEGEFLLRVFHTKTDGYEEIFSTRFSGESDFPISASEGVIWFSLTAQTAGKVFSADYRTNSLPTREAKLLVVVCTYKREAFVQKTAAVLTSLSNVLSDRLFTFVVDNGNTLPPSKNDSLVVFPNKNFGGSGGFTRGIIEGLKRKKHYPFTHFLLMDDDVICDPETILRTSALLSYLNDEYASATLAGGMLRLDEPTVQSESANYWDEGRGAVVPRRHNVDLSDFENVIKNESEEKINYASWWYCAYPADYPDENNLPLPLFIKRDDVEYGLRKGGKYMTLNGIGVWHEPFEKKRPALLEYYYVRNRLAMDFSLGRAREKRYYKRYLLKETLLSCLRFRYNEANSLLAGAEDFLSGTEFFYESDPEEKNDEVRKYNAPLSPVTDEEIAACSGPKLLKGKLGKLLRLLTANGWLLPTKKCVLVPLARPSYKLFFGAKRALQYDPDTKKGYYTERSFKNLFACMKRYTKIKRSFGKRYKELLSDYEKNGARLKTLAFWQEYLGLKEE